MFKAKNLHEKILAVLLLLIIELLWLHHSTDAVFILFHCFPTPFFIVSFIHVLRLGGGRSGEVSSFGLGLSSLGRWGRVRRYAQFYRQFALVRSLRPTSLMFQDLTPLIRGSAG